MVWHHIWLLFCSYSIEWWNWQVGGLKCSLYSDYTMMNKRPVCSRLCAKSDDQLKYEQEQCSMPVPVLNVLWQQPEPGSEHLLVCPETNASFHQFPSDPESRTRWLCRNRAWILGAGGLLQTCGHSKTISFSFIFLTLHTPSSMPRSLVYHNGTFASIL